MTIPPSRAPDPRTKEAPETRRSEIDDAAVESVMLDLLRPQVEVMKRFNQPDRDEYMDQLRAYVRRALVRAFDPEARTESGEATDA